MIKQYKKGEDIQLSKNFHLSEFECPCSECQWTLIDTEHVEYLQRKRDKWKKSIKITSGYRCDAHNKRVGGATYSQHKEGTATDIQVKGMAPNEVADDCEDANGLGRYNTFTHVDNRKLPKGKRKARWDFR